MPVRSTKNILSILLLGAIYLALAAAAIKLTRFEGGVAFISVANAALLARLLTLRPRHWVPYLAVCAAAGMVATAWVGLGPMAAVPMVPMNLGEALAAALILRRASSRPGKMGSRARLPWFLFAAGVAAPALSAFGGAAVATVFGSGSYWSNWGHWYAGHALGALTFTPIAVYFLRGDAKAWAVMARPAAAAEAAALTSLVAITCVLVFAQDGLPLLFLPMVPIILATFRLGRLAAAVSIVLLTVISGWLTIAGHGPLGAVAGPVGEQVQFLQFYLACTVVTILPVSAELARRSALYRRLHESEARYRLLTENSTDIILNLDLHGRIRFASPSIQQIGGYTPAGVVGRRASNTVHRDDVGEVIRAHARAIDDPTSTIVAEFRARPFTGEARWFETQTRAVTDEAGQVSGVVSAIRDVSHRKTVESRLFHAAMNDRLTGIANRRAFDSQLELAIDGAGPDGFGCVALFDLDHFKAVNDRHGHAAGGAVLRMFAELARGRMRDMDFVARFGGEEFAVILPGATAEQAGLVCDRLRVAIASVPISVAGASISVTVSGGVARYDADATAAGVLAAADRALYEAKRSGRDRMRLAA